MRTLACLAAIAVATPALASWDSGLRLTEADLYAADEPGIAELVVSLSNRYPGLTWRCELYGNRVTALEDPVAFDADEGDTLEAMSLGTLEWRGDTGDVFAIQVSCRDLDGHTYGYEERLYFGATPAGFERVDATGAAYEPPAPPDGESDGDGAGSASAATSVGGAEHSGCSTLASGAQFSWGWLGLAAALGLAWLGRRRRGVE